VSFAILWFLIGLGRVSFEVLIGVNVVDVSTLGVLESAHKLGGKRLKKFVLLGSSVAVIDPFAREDEKGRDYVEEDWNPVRDFCP
jgi:hypothetical protein